MQKIAIYKRLTVLLAVAGLVFLFLGGINPAEPGKSNIKDVYAACAQSQQSPPIYAVTDLDRYSADWGLYCEGNPRVSKGNNNNSPLDAETFRCSLTSGGSPFSNVHCYRDLVPRDNTTSLVLSLNFYFPATTCNNQNNTVSRVQALEFSASKWVNNSRYELALQWRATGGEGAAGDTAPNWRYWDASRSPRWFDINPLITQCLQGDAWHSLTLEGEIKNGKVHYQYFIIDGVVHNLDIYANPTSGGGSRDKVALGVQLDGNRKQTPYDLFIDKVTLLQKAVPSVILVAAPNASVNGQTVTLTATVGSALGAPLGSVTFKDGGTTLGTANLSGGKAVLTVNSLGLGNHSLVAFYNGSNDAAQAVSNTFNQTVNKANTSVILGTSPDPSSYGQPVTLQAAVNVLAPGTGLPTGTVTFKEGATLLGTSPLSGNQANLVTNVLPTGNHALTAVYNGDSKFNPATSSSNNQSVNKADSSASLSASSTNIVIGEQVELNVNVTAVAPGAGTPGGMVTLKEGTTVLGSSGLVNGQASFSLSNLDLGSHTLFAEYGGDANFNSSTTTDQSITVEQANSSVTLDSLANAALAGQGVTLVAIVRTMPPGGGVPGGSVTFKEGGTTLGVGTLDSSGVATFTISSLGLGSHPLTAIYGGNSNFTGSTSAVFDQQIADVCSGLVVNSADSSDTTCGTLPYALKQAVLGTSPVIIGFAIPSLTLTANLPVVSNTNGVAITLNGGCNIESGRGVPATRLIKGSGGGNIALRLQDNVIVKGLAITGFTGTSGYAIDVLGDNNNISCSWLGTADGTSAAANGNGVRITGSDNSLGKLNQPESGNLISGNSGVGLLVTTGNNNQAFYNLLGWRKDRSAILENTGGSLKISDGGRLKLGLGNAIH